jgi:2-oxoglutarate ferredoxin oxidoreductase subunit beta
MPLTFDQFDQMPTWCAGCGNYPIQMSLKKALENEQKKIKDVLFCFDIGCNGNGADKFGGYSLHGLHGRVLPLAAGAKLGNPELTVIASAGDGATFSEGINHLIHAIRNDYPVVFLIHDNHNYALTTGQPSATTAKGCTMNSAPYGVTADPIRPLDLILSLKPSFIAQTTSADMNHMTDMFQAAIQHKGFACVEILQTCPTYYKQQDDKWYKEQGEDLKENTDYDCFNFEQARQRVEDKTQKIPVGIIYKNKEKTEFLDSIGESNPRNRTQVNTHQDISALY